MTIYYFGPSSSIVRSSNENVDDVLVQASAKVEDDVVDVGISTTSRVLDKGKSIMVEQRVKSC